MRGHVRKRGRLWAFVVELDRDSAQVSDVSDG